MEGLLLMIFCVILLGLGAYFRLRMESMRHNERIAMIEKGIAPAPPEPRRRRYLRSALLFLLLGISTVVCLTGFSYATRERWSAESKYYRLYQMRQQNVPENVVRQAEAELDNTYHYGIPPEAGMMGAIPIIAGLAFLILHKMERQQGGE